MKRSFTHLIEQCRTTSGPYATSPGELQGMFHIRGPRGETLRVMVGNGDYWQESGLPFPAWEHVSVSLERRCPTWEEMCFVKGCFWDADEAVIQIHPPATEYVNFHEHCLHLWKPIGVSLPLPPSICVGPRDREMLTQ